MLVWNQTRINIFLYIMTIGGGGLSMFVQVHVEAKEMGFK